MALNNWDETTASGRRRVFRIEIDNPIAGWVVARFHLERVFVDTNGAPVAQTQAGAWELLLAEALADPVLAPIAGPIAQGLEDLSQKMYEREQATLNNPPTV